MADPPVVMVAALGEPGFSWQPAIKLLTTSPAVVTYDRPGIGPSPPRRAPNPPLPYSAFAAELAALLDQRDVCEPVGLEYTIGAVTCAFP
jgi:pimeloyl-ACP methyl ester carboxylesterase